MPVGGSTVSSRLSNATSQNCLPTALQLASSKPEADWLPTTQEQKYLVFCPIV
ncbi:Protein of unknown function [Pyronema omphalodes CBS 100304]|uniref:Uncharacterized protein n=1 Tax=Pyronema omphalodes (strain CBS 100304) TaxID=1076935 RepID=U4LG43_PYROM|nr:Protein of unknown function [Pyronema omphalodes CBS 100304]